MTLTQAALVAQKLPEGCSREQLNQAAGQVRRAVILKTLWYPEILDPMLASAREYLIASGVAAACIEVKTVPGSFELPLGVETVCARAPGKSTPDLVVALGCIVRGDTPHFDFVSRASVEGLMRVQLDRRLPLGMGVLTVDNMEQARDRAIKGAEAAQAALFMHYIAHADGVSLRQLQG